MLNKVSPNALITGSNGFVGKYLTYELKASGYNVTGIDVAEGYNTIQADILKEKEIRDAIRIVQPDVIFHLAGQASVAKSWVAPQLTFELNLIGTINLMEAAKEYNDKLRLVLVGSSDEYGNAGINRGPIREDVPLMPQTPYAISKKAQEDMAIAYFNVNKMNICMTRSFNHSGAGQKEGFLISDLCSRIVRVERGLEKTVKVGNFNSKRDYTHVKDVVRAYRLIGEVGAAGEIYNVGSGRAYSVSEILERLIDKARCHITVEQDTSKMRSSDASIILSDSSKLFDRTGWTPLFGIDEILQDTLDYYREKDI